MAYGIRIRDAAGNVVLDNNERIARLLDVFSTGTSNGSRSYDTGGGQLSFVVAPNYSGFYDGPYFTLSGATLSWSSPTSFTAQTVFVWSY